MSKNVTQKYLYHPWGLSSEFRPLQGQIKFNSQLTGNFADSFKLAVWIRTSSDILLYLLP